MQSLGAYLREYRLARGLSLDEIARTTRVGHDYLAALERDSLKELPAPVFTKGFIRAYCQVLGEPPDEALSRYQAAFAELLPPPPPTAPALLPRRWGWGPILGGVALVAAFVLGLFLLNMGKKVSLPARPATGSVSFIPAPVQPPAPLVEKPLVGKGEKPTGSRLTARASEPTWIQVQLDNGRVVEELLPAGATREWISEKRFILTVGNAGGVRFELDGRPVPPLGERGAVVRRMVLPPDPSTTQQ